MTEDATDETLFDRYGGMPTVARIVVAFYDRLLHSPELGRHFEGVDMPRLIEHQIQFVAYAMNAPVEFDEAGLASGHSGLRITDDEFDELLGHLDAVLEEHEVARRDRAVLVGRIEARRSHVVGL